MDYWSLENKTALITGGTKGIGKAITEEFLNLGAEVIIVSRTMPELEAVLTRYNNLGYPAYGVDADVSLELDRQKIYDFIHNDIGKLDILVNNVGTNIRKKTEDYTLDEFRKIFQTNTESAFDISKNFFKLLKNSNNPSIINISSISSMITVGFSTAAYSMSKAAMDSLTRFLACEWGQYNIRVNSINPWYVKTPLVAQVLDDKEKRVRIENSTPLRRIGEPEEVARLAAFLAMPASSYLTGVNIELDGGFSKLGIALKQE